MYPEGLFGLDALRLMLVPVGVICTAFLVLYLRREGIPTGRLILLQVLVGMVALAGAKVFSLWVRDWQLYEPLSGELRGGWRYPGALIAFLLLVPLIQRWVVPQLSLRRYMDVLAINVCIGFGLVRLSCFMSGCCVGGACDAWYCLAYEPGSQVWYLQLQQGLLSDASHPSHPVLPLHFLFMAASFLVGAILLWFDPRRSYDGQVALLFLFLHDGAKAALETFRVPYVEQLQITSLSISLLGLLALVLVAWYRKRT